MSIMRYYPLDGSACHLAVTRKYVGTCVYVEEMGNYTRAIIVSSCFLSSARPPEVFALISLLQSRLAFSAGDTSRGLFLVLHSYVTTALANTTHRDNT